MKSKTTKPKPIKPPKPRRMWANTACYRSYSVLESKKNRDFGRPVLVIDLSPESVEALEVKFRQAYFYEGNTLAGAFAAIGIRPSWRRR